MTPELEKAFKKSIKKWKGIIKGTKVDMYAANCALCNWQQQVVKDNPRLLVGQHYCFPCPFLTINVRPCDSETGPYTQWCEESEEVLTTQLTGKQLEYAKKIELKENSDGPMNCRIATNKYAIKDAKQMLKAIKQLYKNHQLVYSKEDDY